MATTRKIICICCLALGLILVAKPGRADFFDWITGREPTPWSTTTASVRSNRLFAWQPITPAATVPSVPQAVPVPQATANYAPVTRYQTKWVQVPVTTYRPVFETNSVTGWPQLQMRACHRYMWQVRRVPVTVMRPLYQGNANPLFPWCWNWTPLNNNCCVPQYRTTAPINPQPYYTGPDVGQPVVAPVPSTTSPIPRGKAANQVPTYPEQETQPADPPQANNNDAAGSPANVTPSNGPSILQRPVEKPASGSESSSPRVIETPKTEPIPDLDRQPLLQNQGPQLLNPRDRTARSLPLHEWTYFGAIQWASRPTMRPAFVATGKGPGQLIQQPSEDLPAPLRWERVQP